MNNKETEAMYLHYFNDFITIKAFAEFYEISEERAKSIIVEGRIINNYVAWNAKLKEQREGDD